MRYCFKVLMVLVAALVVSPGIHAQTPPDLSGIWVALGGLPRTADTAICGIQGVCGALTGVKPEPNPNTAEVPEMLPWAEEQYKKAREGAAPGANPAQQLNPAWTGCMPEGPTELMRRRGFELRQFSDVVLLMYDQDHAVRRVYLDGRRHPANLQPTWNGHSVGRYDGDTLVIETTGIKDKVWVDIQGHPHTNALRVTERIRRVQPERLEIEVTIDDPQTYKKPWKMKLVKGLEEPGPRIWDEAECEELLQLGTHFSAESQTQDQQAKPAPAAGY
ncbi:MAG: hypothetical protein ACRD88_08295 [Terriglobia bacterium]